MTVIITSNGVSARVFCGAVTLSVVVTLSPPTDGQASTIELRLEIDDGEIDVIQPSGPSTSNVKFDWWLPVFEMLRGIAERISGMTIVDGGVSTSAMVSSGMMRVMLMFDSGASIPLRAPDNVRLATTSIVRWPASGRKSDGPNIAVTRDSESPRSMLV